MNKIFLLFISLAAAVMPLGAAAQADTAEHRKLYADINKNLGTLKLGKGKFKAPGKDYTSEVRAWSEGGEVRKIEAIARDDDGDVVTEFYFDKKQLAFVFEVTKGYRDGQKKQHTVNEVRYYFKDSQIFKIVGGLDKVVEKDKKSIADDGKTQAESARDLLKFSQSLIKN